MPSIVPRVGAGEGPSAPTPTSLQCAFLHCTTNIWQTSWHLAIKMQTRTQQLDALRWDRGRLKWGQAAMDPALGPSWS